jgi:hypothetical protein
LHAAASSTVFASKTYSIGEDYVVELQGEGGLGKLVYLGYAVKLKKLYGNSLSEIFICLEATVVCKRKNKPFYNKK